MDTHRNSFVLVTGGRGFIGRAVGKLLQRTGYNVLLLDQERPAPSNAELSEACRPVVCDITKAEQLHRVFEENSIGGIIHLAAILPTAAQRDPFRATQVNVEGSLNVLDTARRFRVPRTVFGSSLSVYGTCPPNQTVSEADRGAPEDLYGAAKLYVERLGEVYRECHGLDLVSLRIGRVVGPGAQSASSPWRSQIFEFLHTRHPAEIALPYAGSERLLLVNVDDVARMLVALLDAARPVHSVYNALCESIEVADLKLMVEGLNPNIRIKLGEQHAKGNPRKLDVSRFQQEFGFQTAPIFEQLQTAARK
jgi:nucleoside-diphosphate-sugar epimerase